MIANYLFSSWRIWKCNSKSRILPKDFIYSQSSLICDCSIYSSLILYKGKFRKYFSSLNNSKLTHHLGHIIMINHLRNSSKPQLPNHNSISFLPVYLPFIILRLLRIIEILIRYSWLRVLRLMTYWLKILMNWRLNRLMLMMMAHHWRLHLHHWWWWHLLGNLMIHIRLLELLLRLEIIRWSCEFLLSRVFRTILFNS